MKDVIINIKGTQGFETDSDVIELTTYGTLSQRDGKFLISYEENEEPNGVIKTLVKAEGNEKVVMKRSGQIESNLTVEKGKRNRCFYAIPQGNLMLGIFGESITNTLNENGGKLTMSYTIDIENGLVSRNIVEISVKEVKNNVSNS